MIGMIYSDDPARDFDAYDIGQARKLERLPKCRICGEPIQQERAVKLWGEWICDKCLDDYREYVPDEE